MASIAGHDEGESESVGELLHSIRPTNESDGATTFPQGLGVAMELLNEELQQEIAPRKLLRQFSLNIPPYGNSVNTGIGSIGGGGGGSGADSARRFSRSAASPHAFADGAGRLDRHLLRRSTRGSVDSLTELEISVDGDAAGMVPTLPVSVVTQAGEPVESSGPMVQPQQPSLSSVTRNDTFEAKFGDGFLGLEFVINDTRRQVMVKSVQDGAWTKTILQIPPWATITRGLLVDAINGRDVVSLMPEEVIDMLQYTSRPLSVRFRRCEEAMVVCKLCERRVDAWSLDEHTNYCVMSRRFELEADQINNSLTRLGTSIQTNLDSEAMRSLLHPEALHFYNALRVISIQASSCDVSQVDSFALCSRLIKILDRIRMQEPTDSSNFAVERGLKYCHHIRNLIHAKMSKMRQTQKVLLQQGPNEGRAPFQRTKSLEEIENGSNRSVPVSLPSARRPSACRVSIRDFRIVKPISKGAFGKVYLARKKTTGDQYAIKVLAKEHVLRKKQIQHIETERDILVSVESPFVVKLFWTFQTKRNLFLVMEYLPGGDFMSLLECIVQLEEQVARVYIAEVALALYHLHLKGCVHRDLKPDNILISSSGHIKLTDFGLSEEGVSLSDSESESPDGEGILGEQHGTLAGESGEQQKHSLEIVDFEDDFNLDLMNPTRPKRHTKKKRAYSHTYGRCGTPDYLSPEIILNEPHGPPVDFWALGVILYEMLVGFPPFNDETVEAIFNNILERQILWPDGDKCLSDEAIDLINRLLEPDPSKRLDWEGVQNHPFFKGIDWDTILDSTPPFVPTLEGPNDTSYFNNRNLTDIFIDDEEFDIDSQSVDSNMVDQQSESGGGEDTASAAVGGNPSSTDSDENLMNEFGALVGAKSGPSTSADDKAIVNSSFKSDHEPSVTVSEPSSRHVSIADDSLYRGENNMRFPSGMYSGPREESAMNEAFRSFSFTNMNALAAASRNEAEMIADNRLSEVENSSSLSILI